MPASSLPERSAPEKLARSPSAPKLSAQMAWLRSMRWTATGRSLVPWLIAVSVSSAELRSQSARMAPRRVAPPSFALDRLAPCRLAPFRLTLRSMADSMLAPTRSAPCMSTWPVVPPRLCPTGAAPPLSPARRAVCAIIRRPGRRSASTKRALFSTALRNSAPRRSERSKLAPWALALVKLAPNRSAKLKSTSRTSAPVKSQPDRTAPFSVTPRRFMPARFWCLRSARRPSFRPSTKRRCAARMRPSSGALIPLESSFKSTPLLMAPAHGPPWSTA